MLGSSRVLIQYSSTGNYGLCRSTSTTSFLPFLSKTQQIFYSAPPVSDSPIKVVDGLALFCRLIHNSPASFSSSRRDATSSKQCEEFEFSNDNVPQSTSLVKESCSGSMSLSPPHPGSINNIVSKPIINEEGDDEFAAEISEWKESILARIKLTEGDEEILEWSLFEAKKLQDKVVHSSAKMEKIQMKILSSLAEVEVRKQKLLDKQEKMEIMLGEISEWQRRILNTLALGEKRQDSDLCYSQAKMRKMEETMKKILVSQMKMEKVEDTVLDACLKCYGMEEQIRQRLTEQIEILIRHPKGSTSWGRRCVKYLVLLSGGAFLFYKSYHCFY